MFSNASLNEESAYCIITTWRNFEKLLDEDEDRIEKEIENAKEILRKARMKDEKRSIKKYE